jgi:shikimate kinase
VKKLETIAIVGMRCSGKTTAGRELAARLNSVFVDTDQVIESRLETSVAEIFAQGRDAEFRVVEETVCLQALRAGGVIALGGGAITSEAVRRCLWSVTTVFLDASDSLISARLQVESRPSLTGQDSAIEAVEVSRQRRPWYLDVADFTVHVDGKSVAQICDEIVKSLKSFGGEEL